MITMLLVAQVAFGAPEALPGSVLRTLLAQHQGDKVLAVVADRQQGGWCYTGPQQGETETLCTVMESAGFFCTPAAISCEPYYQWARDDELDQARDAAAAAGFDVLLIGILEPDAVVAINTRNHTFLGSVGNGALVDLADELAQEMFHSWNYEHEHGRRVRVRVRGLLRYGHMMALRRHLREQSQGLGLQGRLRVKDWARTHTDKRGREVYAGVLYLDTKGDADALVEALRNFKLPGGKLRVQSLGRYAVEVNRL